MKNFVYIAGVKVVICLVHVGGIQMSEEPDIGDYEEYVLSGIEDNASEEVAQKYEEIERIDRVKCTSCVNAKCDKHCRCMCHIEDYKR